jgi:integrator complex subunit 3
LLQAVSAVEEFGSILNDICYNPSAFGGNFEGVRQFLITPTPLEHVASLLTPDVERKFWFLLHNVPTTMSAIYLERQKNRLLPTGFESIFPDLIRYICTIVHPPIEVTRSGVVARWYLIYNLFSYMKVHMILSFSA